ncbi:hypothetical protein [Planktothricoides raciborskii]|uniref:Uncharacterized protein n=1 Tax=Planktothricoides raciborskii GIHE-MW2 TaxID=2792601 RepID=A0AAU8JB71_9CYAN
MPKLPKCNSCQYYAHHYALVCALPPLGIEGENCQDCDLDLNLQSPQFQNLLGLGEPFETKATINNPYSDDSENFHHRNPVSGVFTGIASCQSILNSCKFTNLNSMLDETYPCPVCRYGEISGLTLMNAFGCHFCQHIFTADLSKTASQW